MRTFVLGCLVVVVGTSPLGCSSDRTTEVSGSDGGQTADSKSNADTQPPDGTTPTMDGAPDPDAPAGGCKTDTDCQQGKQWCVKRQCVPCDNSGMVCDIACADGWSTYTRHGCSPCACAPVNACTTDGDCGSKKKCYAGALCWDWCPDGDPSCCLGNICSNAGCDSAPPVGCWVRGCPEGQECRADGCASSGCDCAGTDWGCDDDCGGGVCK